MLRKAFAAVAALSLAATPVLAQNGPTKPESEHVGPIRKDTILPLAIIIGLVLVVFGFTLHTRGNGKKPASP
jgi:hypothetical protein